MSGFIEPVRLTGQRWVTLEPLTREQFRKSPRSLTMANWARLWFTSAPKAKVAEQWVDMRLAVQTPDTGLTFVCAASTAR